MGKKKKKEEIEYRLLVVHSLFAMLTILEEVAEKTCDEKDALYILAKFIGDEVDRDLRRYMSVNQD